MNGWFVVFCFLSALNGLLFRSNTRLAWRLALPLRWARAVFEGPWARLCGLRPLGWARRGSSQVILLIPHRNRVHRIGLWLLPPVLALSACGLLAWLLELPLQSLPLPSETRSTSVLAGELTDFWQQQGRGGLLFLLFCAWVLPLCSLELPGALLLLAGGVGARGLVRALFELGLTWRTFSDGWFASWLYAADGEAWLAGLFLHASLCQLIATLCFLIGLRRRPLRAGPPARRGSRPGR